MVTKSNRTYAAEYLLPVEIKELSFSGEDYYELKSDDLSDTYKAPHWGNRGGLNESIAFKKGAIRVNLGRKLLIVN